MNEEVRSIMHQGVLDRLGKVEQGLSVLTTPEDGILAKMKVGYEKELSKVESKVNWVIGVLLTSFLSAFLTIVISRLFK